MPRRFELELWEAVARHHELAAALEIVGDKLLELARATHLLVRHADLEHGRIETIAQVSSREVKPFAASSSAELQDLGALVAWSRSGDLITCSKRSEHPLIPLLVPAAAKGSVVAAPLALSAEGPTGAALLVGPPHVLEELPVAMMRSLIEPLSVALANDRRLHRLRQRAEANEADKRALLSRLDRQDIIDTVVGGETGLREVIEKVRQVAPTDAPVLILGETGSGKEVLAREIHSHSRRSDGPMVRVNCGAIPTELVDSELFGHEQGSFTGATDRRKGWFERADGGTLFLDEIGELPAPAQVRLLRVLQDGVIDRVGAHKSIAVDVRIIAATHRDLEEMVRRGGFREDLWYRISVFPSRLPPLRERLEDVPALAAHFARRAGTRLGGMALPLSSDDIRMLVSYDWPGNVRELAAVIERAAILGGGRKLELATALGIVRRSGTTSTPPALAGPPITAPPARAQAIDQRAASLDAAMAKHIEAALERSHGRIDGPFGAARALNINPHTLRARMRKLGIDWRRFREGA